MRKLLMMLVVVSALMVSAVFGDGGAGVEWTLVKSSPFGGSGIYAIAYGKDKFVAVGDKGKIAYSSDGVSWTAVKNTAFDKDNSISAIAWGKDRFIAGGYSEAGESDIIGSMAYSLDGINWKKVNDFFNPVDAIVWGDGKFVVSYSGGGGGGVGIAYSSDGITWTHIDSPFTGGESIDVSWGNNKFVAISSVYGSEIASSSDGITWSNATASPFNSDSHISRTVWGKDKFVAKGSDLSRESCRFAYSSNGIAWTAINNGPFGDSRILVSDIAYGNGKFVVGGGSYDRREQTYRKCKLAYSSDGIAWVIVNKYPFGNKRANAIGWGNGMFVAGSSDGQIAYSK